jgi:hypothetical protein
MMETCASNWFLRSALAGSGILLITWFVMRWCRQPAWQLRLGECGLTAALVAGALCCAPSWLTIGYPADVLATPEVSPQRNLELSESTDPLWFTEENWPAEESQPATPDEVLPKAGMDAPARDSQVASVVDEKPRRARMEMHWPSVFLAGYLAIAVAFVGRWLFGFAGCARLLHQAKAPPFATARAYRRAGNAGPFAPRLLVSSRLRVPISCGILRPTIVLPASFCDGSVPSTRLRWVFAHEVSHLRRGDVWTCHFLSLAQAFYFFVPWFWLMRRQVRLCQEYLADQEAIETTSETQTAAPEDYAEFLLGLCRRPAISVHALGVVSHSSDLSRRIAMLLQSEFRVARRCPRWWSFAAAGSFLALAVLASGLGMRAYARPMLRAAGDEKPVKQAEKPKNNPNGDDPAEVPTQQNQWQRQGFNFAQGGEPGQPGFSWGVYNPALAQPGQGFSGTGFGLGLRRLGVLLSKPTPSLEEQLDLPKDHAFVVENVRVDSPAAKAGMKRYDILLKVHGKQVPSDGPDLSRMINKFDADSPIDVVVLRKGKEETLKGIKLAGNEFAGQFGGGGAGGSGFSGQGRGFGQGFAGSGRGQFGSAGGARFGGNQAQGFGGFGGGGPLAGAGQRGIMTSLFRTDDHFTARHQEGTLIISVTGNTDDGKVKVSSVHVQDGRSDNNYESVEKVPEEYRDKVANLVEMCKTGHVKVEVRTRDREEQSKPKD